MMTGLIHSLRNALIVAVAGCSLVMTTGCAGFRSFERSLSTMMIPTSTEAELGRQYAEQIEQEYTLLDDPVASEWLDDVGARLVAHSPESPHEFQFYLTSAEEVNAFAIPGGHCYVNLGLLLYADNEAQVAAVVGHEINHVTMRHGVLQAQRGMGLGVLTSVAAGAFSSPAGQAAAMIAGQGGSLLAMRDFGRDDEREADKYGVEAMYEAGWDPREAARFFEKLNELSQGGEPSLLQSIISTHPPTLERVENIREQIQDYDLTKPLIVDTPEFQEVQRRMRSVYESGRASTTRMEDVKVPVDTKDGAEEGEL